MLDVGTPLMFNFTFVSLWYVGILHKTFTFVSLCYFFNVYVHFDAILLIAAMLIV